MDEFRGGGDGMGLQPLGIGLKLTGMGWGRRNFCGDGVGVGLMSTIRCHSVV